jgi:modulator of FtsH protease
MLQDTSAWQNFYLMCGGAAAALTGLIFLALSMHARAIMAHPLFRDRAFASILSLMSQVFLSAAVLVPGQPAVALGAEIGIVALFFLIRSIWAYRLIDSVDPQFRRRSSSLGQPVHGFSMVWLTEWIAWMLWLVALSASGVELASGIPTGFYLLAISMVYMFGSNVWNAWVLIAEVSH